MSCAELKRGFMRLQAAFVLTLFLATSAFAADWLGSGGNTLWNNADNWNSQTGIPSGNIAFNANAGVNRTVTLDGDHAFNGTCTVATGTAENPFVFDATPEAVAAGSALRQTATSGLSLTGALEIQSGAYKFANDVALDGGWLHLTGGKLTAAYWLTAKGDSTIQVDGGELVTGWRDEGEHSNGRINLGTTDGATVVFRQTAGRIRCSNNTNGGNDAEAFTLAEHKNAVGTAEVSGGTLQVDGNMHLAYGKNARASMSVSGEETRLAVRNTIKIGRGDGASATLTVTDGATVTAGDDIWIGDSGVGAMSVTNATVVVGTESAVKWLSLGRTGDASTGNALTLGEGAVLKVWHIDNAHGVNTVTVDGGTIVGYGDTDGGLFENDANLTVTIGEKGVTFDLPRKNVTVAKTLNGSGPITKTGCAALVLQNNNDYTGTIRVDEGVLQLAAGTYQAAVELSKKSVLAIDLTGVELTEGETVTVLKAADLRLAAGDMLADAVQLIGPVCDCSLAWDAEAKELTATVLSVVADKTRKLTSWTGGFSESTAAQQHIDNDSPWSNGQPNGNNGYDVALVCGDAYICLYDTNTPDLGLFLQRTGQTVFRTTKNYPCLKVRRISGTGTLTLLGAGIYAVAGVTATVARGITIEHGFFASAPNQDTWIDGLSGGALVIDGDCVATNGVPRYVENVILNGMVTVGTERANTFLGMDVNGNNTLNGTLVLSSRFPFRAGNTFGENAKVVLLDGGSIDLGEGLVIPHLEIGGGTFGFNTLPAHAGDVVLNGGKVSFVVSDEDFTVGVPFLVEGVTLAEGVSLEASISIINENYGFYLFVDESTGVIMAHPILLDESAPNVWIGAESGSWTDATQWSRGVPQDGQTVKFVSDARVKMDANKSFDTLALEGGVRVEFRTTNVGSVHPTLLPKSVTGAGTIALYHAGIIPQVAMTIPETFTIEIMNSGSDSWLEGDAEDRVLTINAAIIGEGELVLRDYVVLGGDNSGYTGHVTKTSNMGVYVHPHWTYPPDLGFLRFTNPKAGSAAATWTINSDTYLAFGEGAIAFGSLTLNDYGRGIYVTADAGTDPAVTIQIGALNKNSTLSPKFFVGASSYSAAETELVPSVAIEKIGTGRLVSGLKGIRHYEVEGGELGLRPNTSTVTKFDTRGGRQIDTLVVRSGAKLSGGAGNQPIHSLTMEPGSVLKTTLSEVTEGETVMVVQSEQPVIDGMASVDGVLVEVVNPELVADGDKLTLLTVTGADNLLTGKGALLEGTALSVDEQHPSLAWMVKNKGNKLILAQGGKGLLILIR